MTLKRIYPWHKETSAVKLALKQSINNGNQDSKFVNSAIMYRAGLYGFCVAIVFSIANMSSNFLLSRINEWFSVNSFYLSLIIGFIIGAIIAPMYLKRLLFMGLDLKYVESTINNALHESGSTICIRIINYSWHAES